MFVGRMRLSVQIKISIGIVSYQSIFSIVTKPSKFRTHPKRGNQYSLFYKREESLSCLLQNEYNLIYSDRDKSWLIFNGKADRKSVNTYPGHCLYCFMIQVPCLLTGNRRCPFERNSPHHRLDSLLLHHGCRHHTGNQTGKNQGRSYWGVGDEEAIVQNWSFWVVEQDRILVTYQHNCILHMYHTEHSTGWELQLILSAILFKMTWFESVCFMILDCSS